MSPRRPLPVAARPPAADLGSPTPGGPPAGHIGPLASTIEAHGPFHIADQQVRTAALEALLTRVQPRTGPVLVVGSGSATALTPLLAGLPTAHLLVLEPDPTSRALALGRLADHPAWFGRVSVRPEDFFTATLPERIGGAVLLGALGRFDPGERAAVLAELADRLPSDGVALLDLPTPVRPTRVEPWESATARVGSLSYRTITEAWPLDAERMRWRTTYLTLEDDLVLHEHTAVHEYRHPAPAILAAEATDAGLRLEPVGDGTHWTLTR